jgi:cobalt-zinc-cadmium resistance protein CzcA
VPDITNNQVQVITIAPSLGATDIERLITYPIEQANSNISGLQEIRSFSRFGLSIVTIVFDDNVDVYWARQQVAERIVQVKDQIPKGIAKIDLGPVTTGLGEIYQYSVRPKKGFENKYSVMDLRTIQDWIVRRQLLGVKGVADVSSFGGKLKQYEISIDPNKLNEFGITINDVFDALENNNQNTGGSYIEKGPTVLYIRTEGLMQSQTQIESVFIKSLANGMPLKLKDVASINIGYATRFGAMCFNDEGEVAGAVLMMLKGENSSDVIKRVKEKVEQIKKTLPEGITIEPFLDRTKMVNNAIGTVETNLLEGALIVLFVLILFLGNLRAGFLVASVIPLSMLFAVILMNLFGVSGNLMSLGALDFGLIVDGAVIIVEAVLHQILHHNKLGSKIKLNQIEMNDEVKYSAGKMMNSAVFGQIIILVVYLPIFTLHGIEGKMFKPMAQTVAFALLGAFVLSLTYVPMMSSLVLSKKIVHKKNLSDRMMEKIESWYESIFIRLIRIPKTIITIIVFLFIAAVITLNQLGGEFIPALEEGDFAVETRVLNGSNLKTTIEYTQKAAGILKQRFPEVKQVVTKIGSGEIPTDPMPMEAADMMVILKDKSDWTTASTFDELADTMSKAVSEISGITVSFQFPVQMRFNELLTGAKQDIVCKIFGENLDTLAIYANELGKQVSSIEGTQNLYIESVTGLPQLVIRLNRDAIAEFGLNVNDVNKVVNMSLAGQSAGFIYEGEKRFDLIVRLTNEQRKSINDIKNLLIPISSGRQIPLYQVAEVNMEEGPNQIQREDAKRRIIVGINTEGRDVQSIVEELQKKSEQSIKLPSGYYITYGGSFENLNEAKKRLSIAVPVSLLLIFLLLYFAFSSIKQGLLIYSAIPLSAIGGIFALAIRDMPFSISAGVGFIALFGVAVLNGIVLIAEFNRLKSSGFTDLVLLVITATKTRLRPVLMTACVASLGFLPMALSNGSGAEVQRPLATVVIGGLLIATFLTLFLLPILYVLVEKRNEMKLSKSISIIIFFCFISLANAQDKTPINLQSAIDSALKNNSIITIEKLNSAYQKQLISTATQLPKTIISAEYGQLNSVYYDNKFSVEQAFQLPIVYNREKQLLSNEWNKSNISLKQKKSEITREVSIVFYEMILLEQKRNLIFKMDSLYEQLISKVKLRFEKGEIDVLEKLSAETNAGQLKLQLNQLNHELKNLEFQFQFLLNTKLSYAPSESIIKVKRFTDQEKADTSFIKKLPLLQLFEIQKQNALINTKIQRAALLPEFILLYNNMTMKGFGSDNKFYDGSNRFQSVQLGVGIPFFNKAQRARINSSKLTEQIANENYWLTMKEQVKQFAIYIDAYLQLNNAINYYENTALINADQIISSANKKFTQGEINYIEWNLLLNQSMNIQMEYFDVLRQYNQTIIQLNYLSNTTN